MDGLGGLSVFELHNHKFDRHVCSWAMVMRPASCWLMHAVYADG
jgi:hypothetical protein